MAKVKQYKHQRRVRFSVVLPASVTRHAASARGVLVEFFSPLRLVDVDSSANSLAAAAVVIGVATECLIRRHPSAWRLWNTLELRWKQAATFQPSRMHIGG